jgi:uncharacterized protein
VSVERAVVIRVSGGVPLFAILHEPDRPRQPRVGVSLLNPGLKYRVAPNRLNVRLARRLAREGFFVLRLDPPGIGDSGGDLPERPLPELWESIQRGALVEPVVHAHRAFREACGLSEVVGAGNCGGAITAILACADDPACRRLVLMDVPVTVKGADVRPQDRIRDRRYGAWVLTSYLRRLSDWRAWLRLFTFRSDMATIARALRARFLPQREGGADARAEVSASSEGSSDTERLNDLFVDAFERFEARGGDVLFVNSEQDISLMHFETLFASRLLATPESTRRHSRFTVLGANHIFGIPEWREELLGIVSGWLDDAHGGSARVSAPVASDAKGDRP